VRLLLDEMYPRSIAEQLRARGHDVVSVHEPEHRALEGAHDEDVLAAAASLGRAVVTENVRDYTRLRVEMLARGAGAPALIYTPNRQFPRGSAATVGRLVRALDRLLADDPDTGAETFLRPSP
jgi:hypothetical protein